MLAGWLGRGAIKSDNKSCTIYCAALDATNLVVFPFGCFGCNNFWTLVYVYISYIYVWLIFVCLCPFRFDFNFAGKFEINVGGNNLI